MNIEELIAKLEAASEGNAVLDLSIGHYAWGSNISGITDWADPPHYTTSIDAALTLVPERARVRELGQWDNNGQPAGWFCVLYRWEGDSRGWHEIEYSIGEKCPGVPTPALALCIAALKARAAIAKETVG